MENKNNKKASKASDVSRKIAEERKEWSKEWGLEKQTEGLDAVQAGPPGDAFNKKSEE